MDHKKTTVLVCPLDWGLGHASRMIPLVQDMMHADFHVILGGSGKSFDLLQAAFPSLDRIQLPSMTIRYAAGCSQLPKLLLQLPAMWMNLIKEHQFLKKQLRHHPVDILISDNRYGLYCKDIYTVLITHQISPLLPRWLHLFEYLLYLFLKKLITKFDECWIPDFPSSHNNVSGKLSHRFTLPRRASYIGLLSRFLHVPTLPPSKGKEKYDLVVVLSGPEPQRTLLFHILFLQLRQVNHRTLMICGFSKPNPLPVSEEHIHCVSHLSTPLFHEVLLNAGVIICRSGYSSVMDLLCLKKSAILIPTPGQPEQQYLGEYLSQKGYFVTCNQKDFDLVHALKRYEEKKQNGFAVQDRVNKEYVKQLYGLKKKYKQNTSKSKQES